MSSPVTSVSKGRKGSAAGGGKAWTEEEEVYLLQMRLERVAYKKIASHLDKTELACRLHYHQLSHGGNRRKRNSSISSTSSNASATSPVASPSNSETQLISKRSSSPQSSFSPVNAAGAIQKVGSNMMPKTKGKPLLPKPVEGSAAQRKSTVGKGNKLRVNCNPDSIDKEKLIRIVEAQRACFWESVASQYGGSVDPEFLAKCWQKGFTSTPPTPAISPSSKAVSPPPAAPLSEDGHNTASSTMATVSEVSTPSSAAMSPAPFTGPEVSVKEETMEDRPMECKDKPQDIPAAPTTTTSTPTLESVAQTTGDTVMAE